MQSEEAAAQLDDYHTAEERGLSLLVRPKSCLIVVCADKFHQSMHCQQLSSAVTVELETYLLYPVTLCAVVLCVDVWGLQVPCSSLQYGRGGTFHGIV